MSPHSLVGSHIDGPPSSNGYTNGHTNGFHAEPSVNGHGAEKRSHLRAAPAGEVHDLVCVGFGPASLSIAVALHDSLENGELARSQAPPPKVLFLEKQKQFAWHAGMLLPGAKMQISFIKDMATLRDPRSHFTFLNFLQSQNRLIDFINLNTFLPARSEYEEYLRWCGEHFDEVVRYGQEAVAVSPVTASEGKPVSQFDVSSRNIKTGEITTVRAKNVIMAVGGQPNIPKSLPATHPRILHSSQYAHLVPSILDRRDAPYRVAVVGAGQSAAEIFNNIQTLYPNSQTSLIMRSEFLKPSDDSPFVNSIFNPSYVDDLFPRSSKSRSSVLKDARSTNYGVVRLELIEHLYERMYEQRREFGPDERRWPHRILAATDVVGLESDDIDHETMRLRLRSLREPAGDHGDADGFVDGAQSVLDVDLIIAATGYQRTSHLAMMEQCGDLLPAQADASQSRIGDRAVQVARDYSVQFAPGKVAEGSGIWLQGCNEKTHGLSDTLLSVLATRSGEIVDSIFGTQRRNNKMY